MATPFHAFCPCQIARYPASRVAAAHGSPVLVAAERHGPVHVKVLPGGSLDTKDSYGGSGSAKRGRRTWRRR